LLCYLGVEKKSGSLIVNEEAMNEEVEITIGMPVRNGGQKVRSALESLIGQTKSNIQIIISDNCSTDSTVEICDEFCRLDKRITLVRQSTNIGLIGNFRFVLMQAETPFFMWACHDDLWDPRFCEKNYNNLVANPGAVASVSKVLMSGADGNTEFARGTVPLSGDAAGRLRRFFRDPYDASRFYSLFRTENLRRSFPSDLDVFGYDWAVLALTLLAGDHLEVPEILLHRESHPDNHYFVNWVRRDPRLLNRAFPLLPLTRTLHRLLPPDLFWSIQGVLLRQNAIQSLMYARSLLPVSKSALKTLASLEKILVSKNSKC
jgi:glycosyltransferase involved in cell wall biosynthesis